MVNKQRIIILTFPRLFFVLGLIFSTLSLSSGASKKPLKAKETNTFVEVGKDSTKLTSSTPAPSYVSAPPPPSPSTTTTTTTTSSSKNKLGELPNLGPIQNGIGIDLGLNSAEILGSSPMIALTYSWNPMKLSFFWKTSLLLAPLQSQVSKDNFKSNFTDNNLWIFLDGIICWRFQPWPGSGLPWSFGPYWLAGVSGMYQGGEPNFGGLFGFGMRMPAPWLSKQKWFTEVQARDLLAAQRLTTFKSSLSQNLQMSIGLHRYF